MRVLIVDVDGMNQHKVQKTGGGFCAATPSFQGLPLWDKSAAGTHLSSRRGVTQGSGILSPTPWMIETTVRQDNMRSRLHRRQACMSHAELPERERSLEIGRTLSRRAGAR